MTLSNDYLNASPTYARARALGTRTVPLVRQPEPIWPFVRLLGVFAFGSFALGFVCWFMWVAL